MAHHRIPTTAEFERLGSNQWAVLDAHREALLLEIDGLESGLIRSINGRSPGYHLKNARVRYRRLEALAKAFGFKMDDRGVYVAA